MSAEVDPKISEKLVWMKSYVIRDGAFVSCLADSCEHNYHLKDNYSNKYPPSRTKGTEENLVALLEEYRKETPVTINHCTSSKPPHIRRIMPVHGTCSQYSPKPISK